MVSRRNPQYEGTGSRLISEVDSKALLCFSDTGLLIIDCINDTVTSIEYSIEECNRRQQDSVYDSCSRSGKLIDSI